MRRRARRQRRSDRGEAAVTRGDLIWPGRFIVQFGGRHQAAFDRESEAVAWAQSVAEHYDNRRWVFVTRNRFARRRGLVLALPREDEERATRWWHDQMAVWPGTGDAGGV